ncbi:MAG: hypothetical protein VKK04_26290 [Synechococcales bacterium]|nr:hypothetical protein [Synechococcales bacterium]
MRQFLKSAYRREPLSSFILTVGIVDAVIGGVDLQTSLFLLGVGLMGVAIALRWWKLRHRPDVVLPNRPTMRYLPEHSSRPHLPPLNSPRQHPRD